LKRKHNPDLIKATVGDKEKAPPPSHHRHHITHIITTTTHHNHLTPTHGKNSTQPPQLLYPTTTASQNRSKPNGHTKSETSYLNPKQNNRKRKQ